MIALAIWIGFSAAVAIAAWAAGRKGMVWFIISVMISPPLAILLLCVWSERSSPEQSGPR